jgi:hypothetical protein
MGLNAFNILLNSFYITLIQLFEICKDTCFFFLKKKLQTISHNLIFLIRKELTEK